MSNREDLQDELEVLLGAARDLPPETDRFLAERFVNRLERNPRRRRLTLPRLHSPRSLTAGIMALAMLVGGVQIASHELAGDASSVSAVPLQSSGDSHLLLLRGKRFEPLRAKPQAPIRPSRKP